MTNTEPANAAQWANELDLALAGEYGGTVSAQVDTAYSLGHAAGVTIDLEADDNYGRSLVSADGAMTVRYDEQRNWWVAS